MPSNSYEYAIIRVVPRVEREEFLNVGVLLSYPIQNFLAARIGVDWPRLQAFSPSLNCGLIEEYLRVIVLICEGNTGAGPIGRMSQRARFHWLVAPRSTMIQISPVHSGLCDEPGATLERLFDKMVGTTALQTDEL